MNHSVDKQQTNNSQSLLPKVQTLVGQGSKELLIKALSLYFCFQDSDTPGWAKSIILSALGYFIAPIDGIPDFTPLAGYSDDLGILIAATAVVALHIRDKHKQEAHELLSQLFTQKP